MDTEPYNLIDLLTNSVTSLVDRGFNISDVQTAKSSIGVSLGPIFHNYSLQNCSDCSCCSNSKITNIGNNHSPIMLIGDIPEEEDYFIGVPFIGVPGHLLTIVFNKLGVDRRQIYLTNVVKCWPENNKIPTFEESMICYKHLEYEIALVQPKVILTLGDTAMHVLRNDSKLKITKEHGVWQDFYGIKMLHTLHPRDIICQQDTDALAEAKRVFWLDTKEAFDEVRRVVPDYNLELPISNNKINLRRVS